jgi:poly(A) polymerase
VTVPPSTSSLHLNSDLPASLDHELLDTDAIDVCRRLQDAGFTTYLVGGCVRDALLGRQPKDFDVGTSATPNQVRRLFRNSRLIGRRFRLVHVLVGPKIVEVATFRGAGDGEDESKAVESPFDGAEADDDGFIRRANVFGSPEEDAASRDFTINALFYDPIARRIIDHVGGYSDIKARRIRTIGPPELRFREDPVRILRAIKFSARLGFRIDAPTFAAMPVVAGDIDKCPVARVTEEVFRIAESGHIKDAVTLMNDTDVLRVVLPELADALPELAGRYEKHLELVDQVVRAHRGLPRELVIALLYFPILESCSTSADPSAVGRAVEAWLNPVGVRMHIAVRNRLSIRGLLVLLQRMKDLRRPVRLSPHDWRALPLALTVLRLLYRRDGTGRDVYQHWRQIAADQGLAWVPAESPLVDTGDVHFREPRRPGGDEARSSGSRGMRGAG